MTCAAPSVAIGKTLQCTPKVSGTGNYNSAVTWAVNGASGGNNTVGTIAAGGLYTAPNSVPTPYTVSVTATSVADSTKSASASVIVAGTIATVTQPINSVSGGTITLPDGSSVTIPAGLLAADNTVTLTESSVPTSQPKNPLLAPSGPALYISFSSPPQFQAAKANSQLATQQSTATTTSLSGITFQFNFGQNFPSAANAMAAVASYANQSGAVLQGVASQVLTTAKTATVYLLCKQIIDVLNSTQAAGLTIEVYFVDEAARPPNSPTQGLLVWDSSARQFAPFQSCPGQPAKPHVLVVIHGMLSSVQSTFENKGTTDLIQKEGYGPVYGINYDWWDGLQANGKTVASYLDTIAGCQPGDKIDILAHSEGVPVTLSALVQDQTAKPSVRQLIEVAGPIEGTPVAKTLTEQLGSGRFALMTILANLFGSNNMVFPPPSPGGILDLLNDPFASNLVPGSSELTTIRNSWMSDAVLKKLPIIMVGGTNPDTEIAGIYIPLGTCIQDCFGEFTQERFDGIVGLDSAFGKGLDLPLYRIPAFPLFHTAMVGNEDSTYADPSHVTVMQGIEDQLSNPAPAKLTISTSSPSAGCEDSHWCFGPPGTVFVFSASGVPASSSTLDMYTQDPTGTEDTPISIGSLSDGTVSWIDPTPTSKTPGTYGIWLYDPSSGASNSVIETICSTNCPSSASTVTVAVSPQTTQVPLNNQQQFTATLSGTQNSAVTWSVNGVAGGDSTVGTVSSSGLYTAPAAIPSSPTVTVTATSQADPSMIGTASVTITAQPNNPTPTITLLNPSSLPAGSASQILTISGTGFLASSTVTFNGVGHTATYVSASQLTITLTAADLATAGAYPVVVTNPAPGGGSASATLTVSPASLVTVNPSSALLAEGGTQQFTATVSGGGTVNWSVQEGAVGGTITSAGLYTAPATAGTYHVIATDSTDSSQTATATVTVVNPGTIAFQWTHSWGGSADDFGNSVGTDPFGNVYVAGSTKSFGAGGQDVLVVKYDPSGNVVWAKTWGGPSDDAAYGILVDSQGNSYVVGYTSSFGAGGNDVLILKFDTSGNLIWARTWGGYSFDVGYDITLDPSGNLNIAAESYSFGNAAVLLKVAPDGTLLGSYTWKGPATYDSGYSITTDSNGNTILVGTSWDYSVSPNHNTIFILKYDSQGNLLWNRTWAGPSEDEISGRKTVRTDANGNIYVLGQTSQSCTNSNFSLCDFDVLLLKIDPNGNLVNATRWGGTGLETGNSMWLNSSNEITVVGSTTSFFGGIQSALVQQYDSNGNVLASQVLNSGTASGWNGIFANPSGGFVATGFGPSSTGTWQNTGIASVPAAGSLSTPSGTAASVSGSWGTPSGTTSDAVGVLDTGGGGNDVLTGTFTTGTPN